MFTLRDRPETMILGTWPAVDSLVNLSAHEPLTIQTINQKRRPLAFSNRRASSPSGGLAQRARWRERGGSGFLRVSTTSLAPIPSNRSLGLTGNS
jgi:hypothetical protein